MLPSCGWYLKLWTWMEIIKRVSVESVEIRTKDWDWGNKEEPEKDLTRGDHWWGGRRTRTVCCLSIQVKTAFQCGFSVKEDMSSMMRSENWPLDFTITLIGNFNGSFRVQKTIEEEGDTRNFDRGKERNATEGYGVESFLKDGINYRIPLGMCTHTEIAVLIYNMSSCILNEC